MNVILFMAENHLLEGFFSYDGKICHIKGGLRSEAEPGTYAAVLEASKKALPEGYSDSDEYITRVLVRDALGTKADRTDRLNVLSAAFFVGASESRLRGLLVRYLSTDVPAQALREPEMLELKVALEAKSTRPDVLLQDVENPTSKVADLLKVPEIEKLLRQLQISGKADANVMEAMTERTKFRAKYGQRDTPEGLLDLLLSDIRFHLLSSGTYISSPNLGTGIKTGAQCMSIANWLKRNGLDAKAELDDSTSDSVKFRVRVSLPGNKQK